MVKRELAALGFEVTNAKRVGVRSEFDVVALMGDTIYNFQWKNNAFDLSVIETAPCRVARADRRLVAYYRRALRKERARDRACCRRSSVGARSGTFVVSRFPVITDDPLIIPFNQLARALAGPMAAGR